MSRTLFRRISAAAVTVTLLGAPLAALADDVKPGDAAQSEVFSVDSVQADDSQSEEAIGQPQTTELTAEVQSDMPASGAEEQSVPEPLKSTVKTVESLPKDNEKTGTSGSRVMSVQPAQQRDPNAFVNWDKDFPDRVFREAIQKTKFYSDAYRRATYKDLAGHWNLSVKDYKNIRSIKGIELFTGLRTLDLRGTSVTDVNVENLTRLYELQLANTPICPTLNITVDGVPQKYAAGECGFERYSSSSPFPVGNYILDGRELWFTPGDRHGVNVTPRFEDKKRPLRYSVKNGIYRASTLIDEKIRRDETRTIGRDGTIRTNISLTSVSPQVINTHIIERLAMYAGYWSDSYYEGNNIVKSVGEKFTVYAGFQVADGGKIYPSYNASRNYGDEFAEWVKKNNAPHFGSLPKGTKLDGLYLFYFPPKKMKKGGLCFVRRVV